MPQPGVVHEVDRGLLEQEEVRGPFDVDNGCDDDGGGREAARPLVARKAAENGCVQRISVPWWFMRYATQRCRTLFTTDAVARCLSCKTSSGTIAAIGGAAVMIIGRVAKSSIVRDAFIIPKGVSP